MYLSNIDYFRQIKRPISPPLIKFFFDPLKGRNINYNTLFNLKFREVTHCLGSVKKCPLNASSSYFIKTLRLETAEQVKGKTFSRR